MKKNFGSVYNYTPQFIYSYKPENKAIYIADNIPSNFGYMMPINDKALSSNTYTCIYEQRNKCAIFIAPVSLSSYFSKTFVSYQKYREQKKILLKIKRSASYANVSETPKRRGLLKKSHSYSDLGGLIKIMEIFETPQPDDNC